MTFTIQLTPQGKDVLHGVLPHLERKFRGGIRAALFQVGFNLVKTARDGIQRERKTGLIYTIGPEQRKFLRIKKKRHRASRRGQYPAILTGQTIQGIDFEVKGSSQMEFGIRDRKDRGPKDLPKFLEKTRPTLKLADAARTKDIYNWLRRMPLQRMMQK